MVSSGVKDCFFILDDLYDFKIRFANKDFLDLLGYSSVDKLTDLLSVKEQRDLVELALDKKQYFDFRCVLSAKEGYIGVLIKFSSIGGSVYCKIDEYESDENYIKRLEFENDRLSAFVELTETLLGEFDSNGFLTFASKTAISTFDLGLLDGGITKALGRGVVLKSDVSKLLGVLKKTVSDEVQTCELRLLTEDGYRWFRVSLKGVLDSLGNIARVLVKAEDIEGYKSNEMYLRLKIDTDDLTKCYKKSFLVNSLTDVEVKGCLAFFDIDNFKGINDTYGHLNGDVALKSVARICRDVFSEDGDIVCRFGGDEFCIYSKFSDRVSFEHKIQLVQSRVCKVQIDNDYPLSLSVGIVEATPTLSSIDLLMDVADTTLYIVKENGKNSYKFFNDIR